MRYPTSTGISQRLVTNGQRAKSSYVLLSALATTGVDGNSDCGYKLLSHSFIKSEVALLRLLGARRLSIGGSSSSSLCALGDEPCPERRDLDDLDLLASVSVDVIIRRYGANSYSGVSFSSRFSGIEGMMSPLTVVPLQRGEFTFGLSQFDQSLSSYESTVSGVQENRFIDLVPSVFDLERVRLIGSPSPSASCTSVSSAGSDPGVVDSSNAAAARGRELVPDARIVSWSPAWLQGLVLTASVDLNDPSFPLRYVPCPVIGSSPTVACLRSSMNVHRPCLKS